MKLTELKTMLDATGFPVAYSHFQSTVDNPAPEPPFITYIVDSSSNFFADNKTFQQIQNPQIELYTDKKDIEAESKIESLLESNDLPYETTETYIDSEKLFQKIYDIGVSING